MPYIKKNLIQRFWSKVEKCSDGHWYWRAYIKPNNYGQFWTDKLIPAHVFSYELVHGKIPYGHELHHKCRVKHCVNPEHLKLLTKKEHRRTNKSLTQINVNDIKLCLQVNFSQQLIATIFNTDQRRISDIKLEKIWR